MKKINLKQLKNNISDINVKKIVISLGGIVYDKEETEKYIIFSSVCHNSSSHKLYWYKDSKQFFCFSRCNRAYSIFDLVMKVKKISFSDSIKYVCTVCNIETHEIERYTEGKKEDYWEESLSKYLKTKRGQKNIKIYDPKILDFFDKIYDYSWIKEGITIETMEKFHIGFYPLKQMITIPVFDKDGNLIGIHGRNLNPEMIENGYKYMPVKMLDNSDYIFSTGQVLYGLNMNQYNIKNQGEVNIFEAPKSVLQMETIAKNNNSVALFGVNLTKYKKKLLLDLGIDVVNICLDKQYHAIFNHAKNEEEKKEYSRWEKTVVKIAEQFKGFCKVNVIYDRSNLLEYKDSPSDKGENIWNILYKNKENIF